MVVDTAGYVSEQTVKKQVTINATTWGEVSVPIPAGVKAALKGYGYTWYTTNTYQLFTGQTTLPIRTDQEGSASIPRIFGVPLACREGGNITFRIYNGDSSAHTYDVVFYILSSQYLVGSDYESTGGELIINTGSGSGVSTVVTVQNSSGTTQANVTAKGLDVEAQAPATLNDGTLTTSGATAVALAASTALKKGVLVQSSPSNTANLRVGNATSQSVILTPGDAQFIEIDNLSKVYIIRATATNVTVNYTAS